MEQLTKNANFFVCYAYKYYLEQLQDGKRIFQAKRVPFDITLSFKPFKKMHPDDIKETVAQAARAGYGDMTMECNFFINDQMISFMENRFKNGLFDVLDAISKFIP